MAEAPQPEGTSISGGLILLILIVFLVLWLRQGGWQRLQERKWNFGWQTATTTGAFPFAPNFENLAPHVPVPTGPEGPREPNPYSQ